MGLKQLCTIKIDNERIWPSLNLGKPILKVSLALMRNIRLPCISQVNLILNRGSHRERLANESDISNIAVSMFKKLGIFKKFKLEKAEHRLLGDAVSVKLSKKQVGTMGVLSEKIQRDFGINKSVYLAVFDWDMMMNLVNEKGIVFGDIPKYPEVRRDFSLLLDQYVPFSDIQKIAQQKGGHLLKEIDLFDVYEGKNLPQGKKSYAVKFVWLDTKQTLKDEIVDGLMNDIRASLEKQLGASLR